MWLHQTKRGRQAANIEVRLAEIVVTGDGRTIEHRHQSIDQSPRLLRTAMRQNHEAQFNHLGTKRTAWSEERALEETRGEC